MQTQIAKKNGTWTKTRLKNLLRHKSGRYYARALVGGKEVWQSLGTSHFSVAEVKPRNSWSNTAPFDAAAQASRLQK